MALASYLIVVIAKSMKSCKTDFSYNDDVIWGFRFFRPLSFSYYIFEFFALFDLLKLL